MKWTLADVWGIFAFVLMLAGIAGLSWEMFRDGGWGGQMLGATAAKPMLAVPVVIVGGIMVLAMRGRHSKGDHPFSNALVYALMALGAFFIFRALT